MANKAQERTRRHDLRKARAQEAAVRNRMPSLSYLRLRCTGAYVRLAVETTSIQRLVRKLMGYYDPYVRHDRMLECRSVHVANRHEHLSF